MPFFQRGQVVDKFICATGIPEDAGMREKKKIGGEALQQTASLLAATLESTADGLLVIDNSGIITTYNDKFLSMWHIPESLAAKRDDRILLENVLGQLTDPDGFIEKVRELYAAETRKLIQIDSLTVNLFNLQENTLSVAYVFGLKSTRAVSSR